MAIYKKDNILQENYVIKNQDKTPQIKVNLLVNDNKRVHGCRIKVIKRNTYATFMILKKNGIIHVEPLKHPRMSKEEFNFINDDEIITYVNAFSVFAYDEINDAWTAKVSNNIKLDLKVKEFLNLSKSEIDKYASQAYFINK